MNNLLIIVLDGCSLDYLSKETTPNIYRIAKDGFMKCVKASVPSVTNVNHATILTGKFPAEHGVVGNYYYDKETGEQGFSSSKDSLETETILDIRKREGACTGLLTVKENVLEIFGRGVDFAISVQSPKDIFVRYLDMPNPPAMASFEANYWILEACYRLAKKSKLSAIYCTTNDYMMHHYAPGSKEATEHMGEIDKIIGKIYDLDPSREIYITADHAMNKKTRIINLQQIMKSRGFDVVCHPPIKDPYIENHPYQEGGVSYLYLKDHQEEKVEEVIRFLERASYIESVLSKEEAFRRFNLPVDKIGDFILLAAEDCAFGEVEGEELITDSVRTHGSLYEREIPLIAVNAKDVPQKYRYSRDIVRILMENI